MQGLSELKKYLEKYSFIQGRMDLDTDGILRRLLTAT